MPVDLNKIEGAPARDWFAKRRKDSEFTHFIKTLALDGIYRTAKIKLRNIGKAPIGTPPNRWQKLFKLTPPPTQEQIKYEAYKQSLSALVELLTPDVLNPYLSVDAMELLGYDKIIEQSVKDAEKRRKKEAKKPERKHNG